MKTALCMLASLALAAPAAAQDAAPAAPHEALAYFVGDWKFTGEAAPGPMGPGGPINTAESCEWFEGGFQVVCNGEASTPRGTAQTHAIMAYEPATASYTYYGMNSMGDTFFVRGKRDGKVWTWEDEMKVEGKPMKFKVTLTEDSPTAYAFQMEGSYDGSPWGVLEHGTATKQ